MMTGFARPGFLLLVLAALCLSANAFAAGNQADLESPLGGVNWGDKRSDVVKKVKEQMLSELRNREDIKHDRVAMQRERKRVIDRVEAFKDSYEKLDSKSDYRVSVISDEFIKDNGESLMRIKDNVAQRYYFFVDGRLYKMVVAYNQDYLEGVDFESFVVQAARKYGKPADTSYGTIGGEEQLLSATWKDSKTLLRVANKKEFFDTFTMTFAERETAERLQKVRQARGEDTQEGISSRVQSLTEIERSDANEDVVDSLVGSSEIDLNEGRPVDEQVRHGEEEESSSVASKDDSDEEAKKKPKKSPKKKKKKKRDFGDIDSSSGDDDLIIY